MRLLGLIAAEISLAGRCFHPDRRAMLDGGERSASISKARFGRFALWSGGRKGSTGTEWLAKNDSIIRCGLLGWTHIWLGAKSWIADAVTDASWRSLRDVDTAMPSERTSLKACLDGVPSSIRI
jgi:hypothetical protein